MHKWKNTNVPEMQVFLLRLGGYKIVLLRLCLNTNHVHKVRKYGDGNSSWRILQSTHSIL